MRPTDAAYEVFLTRDKRSRSFEILGWLIVAVNYCSLLYFTIMLRKAGGIFILSLLTIVLLFTIFKKQVLAKNQFRLLPVSFGFSFAWIMIGFIWIGLANCILFVLFQWAMNRQSISFSSTNIELATFPRRSVTW